MSCLVCTKCISGISQFQNQPCQHNMYNLCYKTKHNTVIRPISMNNQTNVFPCHAVCLYKILISSTYGQIYRYYTTMKFLNLALHPLATPKHHLTKSCILFTHILFTNPNYNAHSLSVRCKWKQM